MDAESVSREVFEMLSQSQLGFVIAVWSNGEVSAHRQLGFRNRTVPDGRREAPLTSFVRFTSLPSVYDIKGRIERALSQPPRQRH